MKSLKELLLLDYRRTALSGKEDCLGFEEIYGYLAKKVPYKDKKKIEAHIAQCYNCLDLLSSTYEGITFYKERGCSMKKETMFLVGAIVAFILSFILSRFFLQFLAAFIILGVKWIVDSKTNRMLIMVYDAWKRGGNREVGKILEDIERR